MHELRCLRQSMPHGGHRSQGRVQRSRHLHQVPGLRAECTRHAKYFEDAAFLSHVAMLEQNFTEPKKNEAFL